ncbi:MAG: bifunctional transaldolase/phosoglucose isomerase [Acidobacteria bacterium]|nr:bifunctional transaldolase/phosoglucose isomerase [Acidobacteriota bacterium]
MVNEMQYSLPQHVRRAFDTNVELWGAEKRVGRVWAKDASVWTGTDEADWLGWLTIVEEENTKIADYLALQKDIEHGAFTDVLLMGMGGSSLCPEVLAITFGKRHFHILDSTSPTQIAAVESRLDLRRTLFIVASKSGSTLEPNCFKQYFFERVSQLVGRENAGQQFIAITDPGSKMEQVAIGDGFLHVFYGKPSIGGRFSALSAFGLTAAAAMGLDVAKFLRNTSPMIDACKNARIADNPGAELGLFLGTCQRNGRDKVTIFTSPEIYDLGAWLEQLVAESTGKSGIALIPVDREPLEPTAKYGGDRIFAFIRMKGDRSYDEKITELTVAGHPVVQIRLDSKETLGQEFFRWEFATAVAGSIMGINPFNQPDVEAAKIEARKLTEEYEKDGHFPDEEPFFSSDGYKLFSDEGYGNKLLSKVSEPEIAALLWAHFDSLGEGDYFALLAFIEMNAEHERLLQKLREKVLNQHKVATCLGFGPRFLHSTGQAYKGGANNGVFLQITCDDAIDLPVPYQKYTFGVVREAQARGDLQVLIDRGRRALRVHLPGDTKRALDHLVSIT